VRSARAPPDERHNTADEHQRAQQQREEPVKNIVPCSASTTVKPPPKTSKPPCITNHPVMFTPAPAGEVTHCRNVEPITAAPMRMGEDAEEHGTAGLVRSLSVAADVSLLGLGHVTLRIPLGRLSVRLALLRVGACGYCW